MHILVSFPVRISYTTRFYFKINHIIHSHSDWFRSFLARVHIHSVQLHTSRIYIQMYKHIYTTLWLYPFALPILLKKYRNIPLTTYLYMIYTQTNTRTRSALDENRSYRCERGIHIVCCILRSRFVLQVFEIVSNSHNSTIIPYWTRNKQNDQKFVFYPNSSICLRKLNAKNINN